MSVANTGKQRKRTAEPPGLLPIESESESVAEPAPRRVKPGDVVVYRQYIRPRHTSFPDYREHMAIVLSVDVGSGTADLTVLDSFTERVWSQSGVPFSPGPAADHWTWPDADETP